MTIPFQPVSPLPTSTKLLHGHLLRKSLLHTRVISSAFPTHQLGSPTTRLEDMPFLAAGRTYTTIQRTPWLLYRLLLGQHATFTCFFPMLLLHCIVPKPTSLERPPVAH